MATQRYISTSFWTDKWVRSLDPSERYLYLYLLTNPETNIAGIYDITIDRIAFDTGYDERTLRPMLERFAKAGKAYYLYDEWVVIPSWPRHQKIGERDNNRKGIDAILLDLPDDIFWSLEKLGYQYPYLDTLERPLQAPSKPLARESNYINSDINSDSDLDSDSSKTPTVAKTPPSDQIEDTPFEDQDLPTKAESVPAIADAENDDELYKAVQADFLTHQPQQRFTDYGKEGKAIKQLIEKARARSPDRPAEFLGSMIKMFHHLRKHGDKYWRGQPPLPSVLNSSAIWDRVLYEGQERYQAEVEAEDIYEGVPW